MFDHCGRDPVVGDEESVVLLLFPGALNLVSKHLEVGWRSTKTVDYLDGGIDSADLVDDWLGRALGEVGKQREDGDLVIGSLHGG